MGIDITRHDVKGLARALMKQYMIREAEKKRHMLLLTCLESKVKMYRQMGFSDRGMANSAWGGEQWHEMYYVLKENKIP